MQARCSRKIIVAPVDKS